MNFDGIISYWNSGAERAFGYTSDEAVGRPAVMLSPSVEGREEVEILDRVRRGEHLTDVVAIRAAKGGRMIRVSRTISPVRDPSGRIIGASKVVRDITALEREEEASLASEAKFRTAFADATIGFAMATPDGIFLEANAAYSAMTGYMPDELARTSFARLIHPDDLAENMTFIRRMLDGTIPGFVIENRYLKKNGDTVWVRKSVSLERDPDGNPSRVIALAEDVTERKEAETALLASEHSIQATLDALTAHICVLDGEGTILSVNEAWRRFAEENGTDPRLVGESANYLEACRNTIGDGSADAEKFSAGLEGVLSGRIDSFSGVYPCHSSTRERWFEARASRLRGGDPAQVVVAHEDITERIQAESSLRQYAERLASMSRRLIMAEEGERRRIARELHDEIGQSLTAVKIHLQVIDEGLAGPAGVKSRLADSIGLIERLLSQVRSISLDLRPSLLDDLGLVASLESLVRRQAKLAGFTAGFVPMVDDLDFRLEPEIETACYRVAQEALTNVVRHAEARDVRVALRLEEDEIHLLVRDDGIGFDPDEVGSRAGAGASLGVLGMKERVALLGGQFTIHSAPGRGTEITARFPIGPRSSGEGGEIR